MTVQPSLEVGYFSSNFWSKSLKEFVIISGEGWLVFILLPRNLRKCREE